MHRFLKWVGTQTEKQESEITSIDEAIRFSDSAYFDFATKSLVPDRTKDWTRDEKETIIQLLKKLRVTAPGLLTLAAAGQPIELIRVSNLTVIHGAKPCALAGQNTIVFGDNYFSIPNRFHALAHEMTHLADNEYFVAFSKEWIALAEPLMKEYRNHSVDRQTKLLLQQTRWPGDYACENLIEALAEYIACYADNKHFDSVKFFETAIAPLIINPDLKIIKWKKRLWLARKARKTQNLRLAKREFEQACKLFPDKPFPYFQLAGIAASCGDYRNTIYYTEKMITSFKLVISSSLIEQNYIYLILQTFAGSGAPRQKTTEFVKWLQKMYPDDSEICKFAKFCARKDGESETYYGL